MVQAEELTEGAVLEALRKGRFYATTGPEIHQIEIRDEREIVVSCSPAESVIFYSNTPWVKGRSVIRPNMTECRYLIDRDDSFVRVEVRDKEGRKAWSSPIRV